MGWISEMGAVVVGLGGLAFGWRERSRAFAHERTLVDLEAVRSVIEQGAVHLHRVSYALDRARGGVVRDASAIGVQLEALGESYDELSERMKVRMGPSHPATRHFVAANEAVLEIYRAVGMIQLEEPTDEPAERRDRAQFIEQQRKRIAQARMTFDEERLRFVDSAAAAAGARLGN